MRLLALTIRSRDLDVVGHQTPDEPGELPRDGDDGDVAVLRGGDRVEPGVETTLGRPRVGEELGRLTFAPPAQVDPDGGTVPVAPGSFDEHAADVCVAGLGYGASDAPRGPLECSEGTSPVKAMKDGAPGKRRKSQTSAVMLTAESVSIPRRHRSLATGSASGKLGSGFDLGSDRG